VVVAAAAVAVARPQLAPQALRPIRRLLRFVLVAQLPRRSRKNSRKVRKVRAVGVEAAVGSK
jgi:hypothetical protein